MQLIFWGSCLNTVPFTVKFIKVRVAFTHTWKDLILPTVNQGSGRPPAAIFACPKKKSAKFNVAGAWLGFQPPPPLLLQFIARHLGSPMLSSWAFWLALVRGSPMNPNKHSAGTASWIVDLCLRCLENAENKPQQQNCAGALFWFHTRKRKKERKKATKTTSFFNNWNKMAPY